MRNFIVIILLFLFCSCSIKSKIDFKLSSKAESKEYKKIDNKKSLYVYTFKDVSYDEKAKGIIDKTINSLPIKTIPEHYSKWSDLVVKYYEWETPKALIIMESYFPKDTIDMFKVKIWITTK